MANSHNNRNKGDNDNSMVIAMTKSLEKETERVQISVDTAESFQKQSLDCRNSMMDLARSYEHKLSRIENRLDDILQTLLQDNDKLIILKNYREQKVNVNKIRQLGETKE